MKDHVNKHIIHLKKEARQNEVSKLQIFWLKYNFYRDASYIFQVVLKMSRQI